jgi:Leucine-rich repeat (LRR) protein
VLRKFPPPIPSLKKLNVEGNELESLPIDVYKFVSLSELNISNNQLDDLPGGGKERREKIILVKKK